MIFPPSDVGSGTRRPPNALSASLFPSLSSFSSNLASPNGGVRGSVPFLPSGRQRSMRSVFSGLRGCPEGFRPVGSEGQGSAIATDMTVLQEGESSPGGFQTLSRKEKT